MRTVARISRVLMWIVLALSVLFQSLAVWGIQRYNDSHGGIQSYEYGGLVTATILMVAAVITFSALRRGKGIVLIVAAVLGVCFIWFAHTLHAYYSYGEAVPLHPEQYLSLWEALWRHALPALIPVLMLPIWLVHREDRRAADLAEERAEVPSVLGGLTDFTMGTLPEEKAAPRSTKKRRK